MTTFPASKPRWADLSVLHEGTLPPRSHLFSYSNKTDALTYDSSKSDSFLLSGEGWKFNLAPNPFEAPENLTTLDTTAWPNITVPGIWQLQGHGAGPQYVNVQYPFPVDPPHPPYTANETGSYVRTFTLPSDYSDKQLRLRFEGCDSAALVLLNGKELGYSQGARNPFEFDITEHVKWNEPNTLGVHVYQFCDGSYLEDQDQWRFSGIYRDVRILAFPKEHIQDFFVKTILDDQYRDAKLSVDVEVQGEGDVQLELLDTRASTVATASSSAKNNKATFTLDIAAPEKWTAETPNLYTLLLTFHNQVLAHRIGFRRIEIKDSVYLINGRRVVFRGANRHEHHPKHGRAVPYDFLRNDLLLMKQHNINAVRTCHQPSDPALYDLADTLGLYVMDEADMECHGFSTIEEMALPTDQQSLHYLEKKINLNKTNGKWTSDNPDWEEAYVDRARQLIHRDKNHACVVIWSLGNEAFYGRNFQSMYDYIVAYDNTRPVHYEGDLECETVDMYSKMYPEVSEIIEHGENPKYNKPLVLCEYVHAMGNGPGAIREYVEAFYKYESLMGGFEWEWANHGLLKKNDDGEEFYAYGGDFGDVPNDSNFVMDGMVDSKHVPGPGLKEYAKAIEPVQVLDGNSEKIQIVNRYDFVGLEHLQCQWEVVGDGYHQQGGKLELPKVAPGQTADVKLPSIETDKLTTETYLNLSFHLAKETAWASADHVVATGQIQLKAPTPYPVPNAAGTSLKLTSSPTKLEISCPASAWTFDLARGKLTSWRKADTEVLHDGRGPALDFYRAPTDNDAPADGADWLKRRVNMLKTDTRTVTYSSSSSDDTVTVTVQSHISPTSLSWSIAASTTYTFRASGDVHMSCKGVPQGQNQPATLPRVGLTLAVPPSLDTVDWFGRGPGESYADKKLAQRYGNWTASVDDLFVDYEFPQENGNRTDVRWCRLTSSASSSDTVGLKAHFGTQQGFSFAAMRYETADLDEAKHPFELKKKKRDYVVLRLDARHHGLGTGSCGPKTMDQYALKMGEFEFEVDLI